MGWPTWLPRPIELLRCQSGNTAPFMIPAAIVQSILAAIPSPWPKCGQYLCTYVHRGVCLGRSCSQNTTSLIFTINKFLVTFFNLSTTIIFKTQLRGPKPCSINWTPIILSILKSINKGLELNSSSVSVNSFNKV